MRRIWQRAAVVSILLTAIVPGDRSIAAPTEARLSDEEYKVLSAFIDDVTSDEISLKRNVVVIVDHTTASSTPVLENPTASVDDGMIKDLLDKSQSEVRLKPRFRTRVRLLLMSKKDSDHLPWERGAPADPYLGILNLSRVGFNSDHTKAVMEFIYVFGNLGMEGGYAVLVQQGRKWSVVNKVVRVVS